jgi:hypothetical protein
MVINESKFMRILDKYCAWLSFKLFDPFSGEEEIACKA